MRGENAHFSYCTDKELATIYSLFFDGGSVRQLY